MDSDVIVVERDLTELDNFVSDFLKIIKKHCNYLVVSGYVSISTGRTRGTEDVDILLPRLSRERFEGLFNELYSNGFWCYQGDSLEEVFSYVEKKENIRFARYDEIFPNMEVISIDESDKAKWFEFNNFQMLRISDFEFRIPFLEFEILYKEIILGSEKDVSDARHLREFFAEILTEKKFDVCRKIIMEDKNG